MRQKKNKSKGIVASTAGRKFLKSQTRTLVQMMADDAAGWKELPMIGKMFYEHPSEAIKALRKGSALYRDFSVDTYCLCLIIYDEWIARSKKKKILKKNPKYNSLNGIVSDNLDVLCAFIHFDYNKIEPAKKSGEKAFKGQIPRQPIIDRCIERYRRLVINEPKKFHEFRNIQPKRQDFDSVVRRSQKRQKLK